MVWAWWGSRDVHEVCVAIQVNPARSRSPESRVEPEKCLHALASSQGRECQPCPMHCRAVGGSHPLLGPRTGENCLGAPQDSAANDQALGFAEPHLKSLGWSVCCVPPSAGEKAETAKPQLTKPGGFPSLSYPHSAEIPRVRGHEGGAWHTRRRNHSLLTADQRLMCHVSQYVLFTWSVVSSPFQKLNQTQAWNTSVWI